MKLIGSRIFIIFLSISTLNTNAQNLVPNPSFESIVLCPPGYTYLYYAPPWFQPQTYNGTVTNSSSTDLFNTCAGSSVFSCGVPLNFSGSQSPRTGDGYAGFTAYADTVNTREYLEVELISTLIANKKYCIEFYLSLADSSTIAISNIGVHFSLDSLLDTTFHAIEYISIQIENDSANFLTSKLNWMKVFGTFTAQGGEKFITIGNFKSPNNTNFQNVGGSSQPLNRSYYYIDDISVMDCNDTSTSINEVEINYHFNLYPNPNNGSFSVEYAIEENDQADLCIYSVEGRKIACYKLNANDKKILIQENLFSNGMYFYQIHLNGKIAMQDKLIIIK